MLTYLNFDLWIDSPEQKLSDERDLAKREYRVRASSLVGEATAPFRFPFDKGTLSKLLTGLRSLELDVSSIQDLGTSLFLNAFSGPVLDLFRKSQAAAHIEEARLRIRLQTPPPELAELPWEYLFDPEHRQFLATSIETPILRYLPLPERKPLKMRHPLRILVAISSPEDFDRLDVEREWRNLQQALAGNPRVEIVRLERPTLEALLSTLRRSDFHIFHYIGHGTFNRENREGLLVLEREDRKSHMVPGWALGEALHDERTLRLAVINSCEGASFGGADPFAGVAQAFVQKGIPAVIAMQTVITDDTAVVFARELYKALSDGYPVDAALTEARKLIFMSGNPMEWGSPVLFLRSQDGQILDIEMRHEEDTEQAPPAREIQPASIPAPAQEPARREVVTPARDPAQEPRFWLAGDSPPELDWEQAFRSPKISWASRGAAVAKTLEETVPGDPVLAFRTLGNFLFGIGCVDGPPAVQKEGRSSRATLPVRPVIRLDNGISQDEIRQAAPELRLLSRGRPFTAVDDEHWAILRALIFHNNPSLPIDQLPPSRVPVKVRAEIEQVSLRDPSLPEGLLQSNTTVRGSIQLRNRGNVSWSQGETWIVTCRWWPARRPSSSPARQWDWTFVMETAVPPGGFVELSHYFELPEKPGLYRAQWTAGPSAQSGEPVVKIEPVIVNRGRHLADFVKGRMSLLKIPRRDLEARLPSGFLASLFEYEVETPPGALLEELATFLDVSLSKLGALADPLLEGSLEEMEKFSTPAEEQQEPPPAPEVKAIETPEPAPAAPSPVAPRSAPPPPPAVAAPPQIVAAAPILVREPPPEEHTVAIEIGPAEVELRFRDRTYRSPNRIDPASLLEASSSPARYGRTLFEAVLHAESDEGHGGSTLAGYDRARVEAPAGLRIELELRSLDLQERKWEYLLDPRDASRPLAALQTSPFYRRAGNSHRPTAEARPLKVLAAIANPVTLGRTLDDDGKPVNERISSLIRLDAAREREILEASLRRLRDAGIAEYTILDGETGPPVTLDALLAELQTGYHVLHLLAHGLPFESTYHLVLEDPARRHRFVTAEDFRKILMDGPLRLVVLASCQSATPDTARTLRSLGQSLVEKIPAVVAMQDEVRVDTAQLFTQRFYDHLARTGRVDMAMAATRFEIYQRSKGDQWQWGIPVLLMSTGDGRLFDVDEERATSDLPPLEPQVRSYPDLAPMKIGRAVEAAARSYGLPVQEVAPLRAAVAAPSTDGGSAGILTPPQDRDSLRHLQPLAIRAADLQQSVKEATGLDLEANVYGQIASALNAGKHVILIGPPGTGKTSLAHAVCSYASGQGFAAGTALTTATADWTAFDTVGGYVPTAGQTLQFRAGVFLEAIRTGRWLVIDEINRAEIDKAFGELFTVLAGQAVDLPYTVGPHRVRVVPPAAKDPGAWLPADPPPGYDYVVHPNWRVLATMNVYDKSHLFTLSFAFMRRFAFVDVDLPGKEIYQALIDRWLQASRLPAGGDHAQGIRKVLGDLLDPGNPLACCRELGPAIVKDMIEYMSNRYEPGTQPMELLAEALLLYVTPQLDGIDSERIVGVRRFLAGLVGGAAFGERLLRRVQSLYPHVLSWGDP